MSGETLVFPGSATTLQNSAGSTSIANNAISAAAATSISSATQYCYPDAEFELLADFASNPTANKSVDLLIRKKNMFSNTGSNAGVPTASFLREYKTSFVPSSVSGIQLMRAEARDMPHGEYEVYLYNNGTGVTINAWILRAIPLSYKAAT